jgi:hypothetical protein
MADLGAGRSVQTPDIRIPDSDVCPTLPTICDIYAADFELPVVDFDL